MFDFSLFRLVTIIRKEFIQMRRDRMTFGMMVGIPVLQLVLFGFAINTDPKHLPAAVICYDDGPFARSFLAGLKNTRYFDFMKRVESTREGEQLLKEGKTQFVVTIPPDFNKNILRGESPSLLIECDATDPMAVGNAVAAAEKVANSVFRRDLEGVSSSLISRAPPVDIIVHNKFNPDQITAFNTVPGLLGVVLTLTMVFITALAITREVERGTMENLLSMPARPLEVMIGKIVPYILVGYVQVVLILLGARYIFGLPFYGSLGLLLFVCLFFIAANLSVGVTFSTIARNQLQAVQMSIFFFLPSIMLSGFMFPFRGMPEWAQVIGSVLPLTHFNIIVRGIMLKGCGFNEISAQLCYIIAFLVVVLTIGSLRYRRTLD